MSTSKELNFLEEGFKIIQEYLEETVEGRCHVHKFISPQDLSKKIRFGFDPDPVTHEQLSRMCREVMSAQPHCHHPHFHNQLFGGFSQYSVVGDMMTSAMNGSMYTYEIAPSFLLMEKQLFQLIRLRLGWGQIEGLMAPGGSYANFLAIVCSRYKAFPEVKDKGLWALPQLRIFTSEMGHYSVKKHVMACGMGYDSLVLVPSDGNGCMIPAELDKKIREVKARGEFPVMVNATFGTTVLGACDPIEDIVPICREHDVWLHVDGAFGGSMIISDKLKGKIAGFKDIDSYTWDPHKGLEVPLQASIYCHKHVGVLRASNSASAGYLFHRVRDYDSALDTGDMALQCGRHVDVFKVWTYFQGKGLKAIAEGVENSHENALHAARYMRLHQTRFELFKQPQTFSVCFYYIPESMRERPHDEDFYKELGDIAVKAKKLMLEKGKVMVGYSEVPGNPHYFWRLITLNNKNSPKDVEFELEHIGELCEQVARGQSQ